MNKQLIMKIDRLHTRVKGQVDYRDTVDTLALSRTNFSKSEVSMIERSLGISCSTSGDLSAVTVLAAVNSKVDKMKKSLQTLLQNSQSELDVKWSGREEDITEYVETLLNILKD